MKIEVNELNPCAVLSARLLSEERERFNILVSEKYHKKCSEEFPSTDYVHVDVTLDVCIKKVRPESLEGKLKNHYAVCRSLLSLNHRTYFIHKEDEQTFNALLKENNK